MADLNMAAFLSIFLNDEDRRYGSGKGKRGQARDKSNFIVKPHGRGKFYGSKILSVPLERKYTK